MSENFNFKNPIVLSLITFVIITGFQIYQNYYKNKKDDDITIMAQDKQKGYNTYGNISYDKLNNIYRKNHHLYEVMGDNRKLYFDIEYTPENDSDDLNKRALLMQFIRSLFEDLKIPYTDESEKLIITGAFGKGEKGPF